MKSLIGSRAICYHFHEFSKVRKLGKFDYLTDEKLKNDGEIVYYQSDNDILKYILKNSGKVVLPDYLLVMLLAGPKSEKHDVDIQFLINQNVPILQDLVNKLKDVQTSKE